MDNKKKSSKGGKRSAQSEEDFLWECSICTYKNNPEAFKCMMCGVSKGTSTRKSRINPDHLAVQVQQALLPPQQPQKKSQGAHGESSSSSQPHDEPGTSSGSQKKKNNYPKQRKPRTPKIKSQLENIDPGSATVYDISVDGVSVQITEYKQKKTDVDNSREGSSSRDAKEPLNTSKNTSNADKNPSDDDSD